MYSLIIIEKMNSKKRTRYIYNDYKHLCSGLEYLLENDLISKDTFFKIEKEEVKIRL